uniref:Uncharacterized protein n=1 Tax=Schizophyllum commune (strain H4-8 / FGSC 9210) TaxID=578458 RepID=D8PPT6_SCHCM
MISSYNGGQVLSRFPDDLAGPSSGCSPAGSQPHDTSDLIDDLNEYFAQFGLREEYDPSDYQLCHTDSDYLMQCDSDRIGCLDCTDTPEEVARAMFLHALANDVREALDDAWVAGRIWREALDREQARSGSRRNSVGSYDPRSDPQILFNEYSRKLHEAIMLYRNSLGLPRLYDEQKAWMKRTIQVRDIKLVR